MIKDEKIITLTAKVVFLEHALRWLLKERYLQTEDPISEVENAAKELKKFFNPNDAETAGVLYLQQAVDSFFDVLRLDLEKDLGNQDMKPPT